MKKVYEDMCDDDRFASDRVLRRRALQSYLLYDARGTAAIFGLPGKSTGEGSISSINTACAHRIGRGQVWIPCDCHGFVDPNLPRLRDLVLESLTWVVSNIVETPAKATGSFSLKKALKILLT